MSKKLVGFSASAETKLMRRPSVGISRRSKLGSAYWFQRQHSTGSCETRSPDVTGSSRGVYSRRPDVKTPVLVAKVRALHEAAMAAARTSLDQAAACGRLLAEAKEAVCADCPVLADVSRYPAQRRNLIF